MARKKTSNNGGASLSELEGLQRLVVESLAGEIKSSISSGEPVSQSTIRNALQLLRDQDVRCVDDTVDQLDKLASLLPPLEMVDMNALSRF